ncbi:5-formyltetrahydrofolate cyclo-ligase [Actibacterium atlanticum]|nr:5-formyltetrahydrofolate cyclo-ligase [Actibacterium atlanticum]
MRKDAAKNRAALCTDAAVRAANSYLERALAPHKGKTVAGYMPMRSELSPLPALTEFAAHSVVAMPVVEGKGMPLVFRIWTPGGALEEGAYGAMIPADTQPATPAVLIVPMLAYDGRGFRLGYGGGYYDRTIAALAPVTIGLAFAGQEVPEVPTNAYDMRLDMIVTEQGVTHNA